MGVFVNFVLNSQNIADCGGNLTKKQACYAYVFVIVVMPKMAKMASEK
jgi:hypothetical protein